MLVTCRITTLLENGLTDLPATGAYATSEGQPKRQSALKFYWQFTLGLRIPLTDSAAEALQPTDRFEDDSE